MRDGRTVLARSPKRRGSQTKHKTVNSGSLSTTTWGFRNPQTYFFLIQLGADAAAAAAPGPGGRPRRSAARDRAAAPEETGAQNKGEAAAPHTQSPRRAPRDPRPLTTAAMFGMTGDHELSLAMDGKAGGYLETDEEIARGGVGERRSPFEADA